MSFDVARSSLIWVPAVDIPARPLSPSLPSARGRRERIADSDMINVQACHVHFYDSKQVLDGNLRLRPWSHPGTWTSGQAGTTTKRFNAQLAIAHIARACNSKRDIGSQ